MAAIEVVPVDHGWFVRPGTETADGVPRVVPLLGYLVRHPRGTLLFDTGGPALRAEASEVGGWAGRGREYLSGASPVVRSCGLRPLR